MNAQKPRIVLDCMICLQAAAREQSRAAACFRFAENHLVQLFISRAILKEVEDVLSRDYIRAHFQTLTDESVAMFLERLRYAAEFVRMVPRHFNYERRDVKDEPYINLAVEVEADYLISRDRDLLDLMSWRQEAGREFQKRFRAMRIVTPEDFLLAMQQTML
ncbi:MAG: putative toxin-antitoxin system toxin component, PIN family [Acidobacteria bacterium]|nr:putative toxin-antitoxin system toxin component, PIN family [Acidobacteriota bacterium]